MIPLGDDNSRLTITPWLTWALIIACIATFVAQVTWGDAFTMRWAATPYELTSGIDLLRPMRIDNGRESALIPHAPGPSPIWLTAVTCMFLHGSLLHLAGNMLFLWIFGDQVEERLGRIRFLAFYVVGGLAGTAAHVLGDRSSPVPLVGASGAISAVLGAYLFIAPFNTVRLLLWIIIPLGVLHIPALLMIGLWFVKEFLALGGPAGGVAHSAHVGGFVAGIVMLPLLIWGRPKPQPRQRVASGFYRAPRR